MDPIFETWIWALEFLFDISINQYFLENIASKFMASIKKTTNKYTTPMIRVQV